MKNNVNRRRVYVRVLRCWMNTFVALLVLGIVGFFTASIGARFIGPKIVLGMLMTGGLMSLFVFIFSPMIVLWITRAKPVDVEKYPLFPELVTELLEGKWIVRPNLYIAKMDVPNAFAFGWGLWRGVAITPALYELLQRSELKAVIAHEVGHLRSRDVALSTFMALLNGGTEEMAKLFLSGKTVLGSGPFGWLIGGIFYLLAKLLTPICRGMVMQQREFSADALGSLYCGSPDPLIKALEKLGAGSPKREENGVISDLMISHPKMNNRIAALEDLKQ